MRATFPQSSQQDETTAVVMLYRVKFVSPRAWSIASFPSPLALVRVTLSQLLGHEEGRSASYLAKFSCPFKPVQ